MSLANIPNDILKNKRSDFLTFIDTTPNSSATWKILGIGIDDYSTAYNPQV